MARKSANGQRIRKNQAGEQSRATTKQESNHGQQPSRMSPWRSYLVVHQLRVNVVELGHADGSRLADVRVLILEALAQGFAHVLHGRGA